MLSAYQITPLLLLVCPLLNCVQCTHPLPRPQSIIRGDTSEGTTKKNPSVKTGRSLIEIPSLTVPPITAPPSVSPAPTEFPTKSPTRAPTKSPTKSPTRNPTKSPTKYPTKSPTSSPTQSPTTSHIPTLPPVFEHDHATFPPSVKTEGETDAPSVVSGAPSVVSGAPSIYSPPSDESSSLPSMFPVVASSPIAASDLFSVGLSSFELVLFVNAPSISTFPTISFTELCTEHLNSVMENLLSENSGFIGVTLNFKGWAKQRRQLFTSSKYSLRWGNRRMQQQVQFISVRYDAEVTFEIALNTPTENTLHLYQEVAFYGNNNDLFVESLQNSGEEVLSFTGQVEFDELDSAPASVPSPNGGTNGQPSNTGDTSNSNSIDANRDNVNNSSNGNSDSVSLNEGLLLGFLIVCIFLLSVAVVFTYKRRRMLQIKRNQKHMRDLENMQVPLNYTPSHYNENDEHARAMSTVRKDDMERFNSNLKVHSSSTSFQPYDESRNKPAANRDKGNLMNYYLRRGSSGHASENISITPELEHIPEYVPEYSPDSLRTYKFQTEETKERDDNDSFKPVRIEDGPIDVDKFNHRKANTQVDLMNDDHQSTRSMDTETRNQVDNVVNKLESVVKNKLERINSRSSTPAYDLYDASTQIPTEAPPLHRGQSSMSFEDLPADVATIADKPRSRTRSMSPLTIIRNRRSRSNSPASLTINPRADDGASLSMADVRATSPVVAIAPPKHRRKRSMSDDAVTRGLDSLLRRGVEKEDTNHENGNNIIPRGRSMSPAPQSLSQQPSHRPPRMPPIPPPVRPSIQNSNDSLSAKGFRRSVSLPSPTSSKAYDSDDDSSLLGKVLTDDARQVVISRVPSLSSLGSLEQTSSPQSGSRPSSPHVNLPPRPMSRQSQVSVGSDPRQQQHDDNAVEMPVLERKHSWSSIDGGHPSTTPIQDNNALGSSSLSLIDHDTMGYHTDGEETDKESEVLYELESPIPDTKSDELCVSSDDDSEIEEIVKRARRKKDKKKSLEEPIALP